MTLRSRSYNRRNIMGFEHGQFYRANPNNGNIVVDSTAARSGNYGMHVTAQSGVLSSVLFRATADNDTQTFYRLFISFVTLPSVERMIFEQQSGLTSDNARLKIRPDGGISLYRNTVLVGTSVSQLVTGRWYMVELGISGDTNMLSLRIDDNTEIAWTSGSVRGANTFTMGALDTGASDFEYYVDDIVIDNACFPGYGRVGFAPLTDVVRDSANWVLTGPDKVSAIQPVIPYDDTTYLQCAVTSSTIMFGIDPIPNNVHTIYGMQLWMRYIRGGASDSSATDRRGYRGQGAGDISLGIAAHTFSSTVKVEYYSPTVASSFWGAWFPEEFQDDHTFGWGSSSANAARVLAAWVEYDYDDRSDSKHRQGTIIVADWEIARNTEFRSTNDELTGNVALSTDWAKFGQNSLKLTHASGGRSVHGYAFDNQGVLFDRIIYHSFWMYCTQRPTSGNVGLWYWLSNVTRVATLFMTSTGALFIQIGATSSAATAANTIPLNTEKHIGIELIVGSSIADTIVRVWVDGEFVKELRVIQTTASDLNGTASLMRFGSPTNVTGGAVVYYDGLVSDLTTRHGTHLKFKTLKPIGPGMYDQASYTAVGDTDKWLCLDDQPFDADITYISIPAVVSNNLNESYELENVPANAVGILPRVTSQFIARSETVTNFVFQELWAQTFDGITQSNIAGASTAGVAYASFNTLLGNIGPHGGHTPASINALEIGFMPSNSNTIARFTAIGLTVAYTAINEYARSNSNSLVAIG